MRTEPVRLASSLDRAGLREALTHVAKLNGGSKLSGQSLFGGPGQQSGLAERLRHLTGQHSLCIDSEGLHVRTGGVERIIAGAVLRPAVVAGQFLVVYRQDISHEAPEVLRIALVLPLSDDSAAFVARLPEAGNLGHAPSEAVEATLTLEDYRAVQRMSLRTPQAWGPLLAAAALIMLGGAGAMLALSLTSLDPGWPLWVKGVAGALIGLIALLAVTATNGRKSLEVLTRSGAQPIGPIRLWCEADALCEQSGPVESRVGWGEVTRVTLDPERANVWIGTHFCVLLPRGSAAREALIARVHERLG